jgi:hypothetical protein
MRISNLLNRECPLRVQCSITYWDIGYDWNRKGRQYIGVPYTGTLQYLWASKSSSCDDNKLVRLDGLVNRLGKTDLRLMFSIWLVFNADGTRWGRFVEQNPNDLGVSEDMKVGMLAILKKRVDIAMSGVLALTIGRDVSVPFLRMISQLRCPSFLQQLTENPPTASKSCKSSITL